VFRIDVASSPVRRYRRERAGLAGRDAHLAAERAERDADALLLIEPTERAAVIGIESPYLERWIGILVGEEPEAGDDGGPTPLRWGQVEDVDAQDVTGPRVLNVHRPVDLVELVERERGECPDGRGRINLAVGRIEAVERDLGAGSDGQDRLDSMCS
jgi:hypothetical protein